jgi:hypothetical protein
MAHNRHRNADQRPKPRTAPTSASRLPGLRWVPVPLALLAAAIGWLLLGGAVGQHAAASEQNVHGFQNTGLSVNVDAMLWLSNDMTGQGPVKNTNPNGFKMDPSMMPGIQTAGNDRLRFEFSIANVSSTLQRYTSRDFRVVTADGASYGPDGNNGSTQPTSTNLRPGFGTTIDLYFDLPTAQTKNLSIEWTRGGTTVGIPVDTNGTLPQPHIH